MNLNQLINEVNNIYFETSSSYRVVASKARELLELLGASTNIKDITREKILIYFNHLKQSGNKSATINAKMCYLSKLLTYAFDNRLIDYKPTIPYIKVKDNNKKRFLSANEYSLMLEYAYSNNLTELYYALAIGYNTGIRISNILALSPEVIDNGYIRVWENKTNKPYSVPMNDTLKLILADFKGFTLNYRQIQYQFTNMIKALQLDTTITLHTLRHTTCSRMVEKGIALPVIQVLMNHKNLSTTMLYTHLSNKQLEDAVKVL